MATPGLAFARSSSPGTRLRWRPKRSIASFSDRAGRHARPASPRRRPAPHRCARDGSRPARSATRRRPVAAGRVARAAVARTSPRRRSCCACRNRDWPSRTRPPVAAEPLCRTRAVGHEHHREARPADAQRPVDVLDVQEQRVVEQPRLVDRSTRDGERSAVGPPDVAERQGRRGLNAAGVPEPCVERRTCVLHFVAVLVEDQAGKQTRVPSRFSGVFQRLRKTHLGDRVVVEQQDPVGAPLERAPDASVVTPGEAEVRPCPDQLHVWETLLDGRGRSRRSSRCRRRWPADRRRRRAPRSVSSPPFQLRTTAMRFTATG